MLSVRCKLRSCKAVGRGERQRERERGGEAEAMASIVCVQVLALVAPVYCGRGACARVAPGPRNTTTWTCDLWLCQTKQIWWVLTRSVRLVVFRASTAGGKSARTQVTRAEHASRGMGWEPRPRVGARTASATGGPGNDFLNSFRGG